MKKTAFVLVLAIALVISLMLPISASPVSSYNNVTDSQGNRIYYEDDGSYTVISPIVKVESPATRSTVQSVEGHVDATNYSSKGVQNWKYTLIGYFTYEPGVSSTCTYATYTSTITGSGWSFSDASNSWSENAAYGHGVYKHKVLFITTENITVDLRIRCDNYGNFY